MNTVFYLSDIFWETDAKRTIFKMLSILRIDLNILVVENIGMDNTLTNDFAMEKRLRSMDPGLHTIFTNTVFSLQYILSNYKLIFPEFTDHTELHSLTVVNFCNQLIGKQIEKMNADELYVLLMGCYFHDTGMGVSVADYEEFRNQIDFGDYFDTHDPNNLSRTIRDYHNEFSGLFIRKYAKFFEIPTPEHLEAVIQVSRGHRKTSLMDENAYPIEYKLKSGNTICLPYLAAMVRLADEIDVTSARNPVELYDLESFTDDQEIFEHEKHRAVTDLRITDEAFTMVIDTKDDALFKALTITAEKMQKTLDDCRRAVNGRTPYVITQERVEILNV